ncbi:hypothetical protein HF521_019183 [Silurus meridionalis]|uniref:Uncharacterized protein n=1 Tax=Silurus meridionalis TaxID=175797 RepID=A0A8T0BFV9_SILME|nr:hypothetical protein HF521_019183 [Silurus meridionalis]
MADATSDPDVDETRKISQVKAGCAAFRSPCYCCWPARFTPPAAKSTESGKPKCSSRLVHFSNFKSVSPEATSGCLRSTRRPCPSGTQTSASKGRTIFLYRFTGTSLPFCPFLNCS